MFRLIILLLVPFFLPAQNIGLQQIDSIVRAEYAAGNFSGSIVIGNRDTILYEQHLGIANRDWDIPVDSNTRFDMASVNKSFVGGLLMLAVEEGKLTLQDGLVDHLADFRYSGTIHPDITLHQMLCHTSGLPDYDGVAPDLKAHGFARLKRLHSSNTEYVDFISQLDPIAPPGEQFNYSKFAYHLLCIVLEETCQKSFSPLLQEKITVPLGMAHTYSSMRNEDIHPQLAEGYNWQADAGQWMRNNFIDLSLGRRIFITSRDLYLWGKAMCDDRLLSDSSRAQMHRNHLTTITDQLSYGYGWVIYEADSDYGMGNLEISSPYLIHGGATEGYRAMLIVINGGEYIFSLLSNSGARTNEMDFSKQLIHLLIVSEHE